MFIISRNWKNLNVQQATGETNCDLFMQWNTTQQLKRTNLYNGVDEFQLRCAKEARHTKLHIQYISIYMKFWNQLIYYERNQISGGLGGRYGRDWFHRGRKVLSGVMEMFCLKWEGNSIDVYICQNHWTLHLKCILYGNYTSNTDITTHPPEILKLFFLMRYHYIPTRNSKIQV